MSSGDGDDQARLDEAIARISGRVAGIIGPPADLGRRVPGSDWTIAETAAHLVAVHRLYRGLLGGAASPFTGRDSFFTEGRARSPVNAELVAECSERDGATLAKLLAEETRAMLDAVSRNPPDRLVPWHWATVPLAEFSGIALFHLLSHGYDIAKALGASFPIDPADARLAIGGLAAVMPLFVDREAARGLSACLEIRVRGGDRRFVVFNDGEVSVERVPPSRVDCHLSADPVALLLVGLGRIGQWGPIARGKLVAWGRNPMLALKLTSLIPSAG